MINQDQCYLKSLEFFIKFEIIESYMEMDIDNPWNYGFGNIDFNDFSQDA